MPPQRRTLRNVVFSLLGKAQAAVFSYIVIRLLLDVLTVEQYGLYSLLFIGVMVNLSMLFQIGIPNMITRYVPEQFTSHNTAGIREIFGKVLRAQLCVGIATVLLTLAFAPQIAKWINFPDDAQIIRVFSLAALIYLLSEIYHVTLSAVFRQQSIFTVTIAYNTLRLILLAIVWWQFRSFMAVVVAEGISLLGCLIFYALSFRRAADIAAAPVAAGASLDWPRMKKFGGLSYLNEVGVSLLSVATDFFLVSGILGGAAAGFYGLANRINDLAQKVLPGKMLAPVIQPLFFSEYGSDKSKAEFGFRILIKATLFPTVAVAVWLAVMSKEVIVYLFDPQYAQAAMLVSVMAIFMPAAAVRLPLGLMLQNHERVDLLIWAKSAAILKIIAGVILIKRYGIEVMPWITGLAVVLQNNFVYFFVKRIAKARMDIWGNIRIWLNAVAAGAVIYLLKPWFNTLVGVILSVALFTALFLIFSLINRGFSKSERDFINSKLPRPLWKF
ncbi:oligosaccharide flippase family protein [bacterium]|nr:oligosaccharide flippase family protein [bacterium]